MPLASEELQRLAVAKYQAERAWVALRKDGDIWFRAWARRDEFDTDAKRLAELTQHVTEQSFGGVAEAVRRARHLVDGLSKRKKRATEAERAAAQALKNSLIIDVSDEGLAEAYVGFATRAGSEAAELTIEAMGRGDAFTWRDVRDQVEREARVAGSKIIQQIQVNHVDRLTDLVLDKVRPGSPKTIAELTADIMAEWPGVAKRAAERIARTESARVWEQANFRVMQANGIKRVKWLIASGPSIGKVVGGRLVGPVCPICLENNAAGFVALELGEADDGLLPSPTGLGSGPGLGGGFGGVFPSGHTMPPAHPNCRCTLLPDLEGWLPPPRADSATRMLNPATAPSTPVLQQKMDSLKGEIRQAVAEHRPKSVAQLLQEFGSEARREVDRVLGPRALEATVIRAEALEKRQVLQPMLSRRRNAVERLQSVTQRLRGQGLTEGAIRQHAEFLEAAAEARLSNEVLRDASRLLARVNEKALGASRAYARATRDVVSNMRPLGGTIQVVPGTPVTIRDTLQEAAQWLPTSWIQASNVARNPLVGAWSGRSSFVRNPLFGRRDTIRLSRDLLTLAPDNPVRVASVVREYGKRVESVVEGVFDFGFDFFLTALQTAAQEAAIAQELAALAPLEGFGAGEVGFDLFPGQAVAQVFGTASGASGASTAQVQGQGLFGEALANYIAGEFDLARGTTVNDWMFGMWLAV